MKHTLKLTITAVGEPGSIFTQPCPPITLHESIIETHDTPASPAPAESPDRNAPRLTLDQSSPAAEPAPHRRAS